MAVKGLVDDCGIIGQVYNDVPKEYHQHFLNALSELEDKDNHVHRSFPISRIHKMDGTGNLSVYRFDIDKTSGWRVYAQYGKDDRLYLCGLSAPSEHDDVAGYIKAHRANFF